MSRSRPRRGEDGYVAVVFGMLALVVFGMAAFAVDVGHWYVVARQEQKAADAAALAGVTFLPGDKSKAFAAAMDYAKANDFADGQNTVSVVPSIDGGPTRLKVTVSKSVPNVFGGLLGIGKTQVTRSGTADFAGPVPLGSPCNEYGNDPETVPTIKRSDNCSDAGQFWANVGSPSAPKSNGDAYQNSMGANTDFDPNGYFYSITLDRPVYDLRVEVFDPALVDVGDLCDRNLTGAALAVNPYAPDGLTRYQSGQSNKYCTGDVRYGGTGEVRTQFTVRSPGPNPWDPLSFPVVSGCQSQYDGYTGDLSKALNFLDPGYQRSVAQVFRQWVPVCSILSAQKGTYLIQVHTNGLGADAASGHNRFAIRAYSASDASAKDAISVSGFGKMAMYANLPDATTTFHLARVLTGAGGSVLNVSLWDVGDSSRAGRIKIMPPSDSNVTFTKCTGTGVVSGPLTDCELQNVDSRFNGQWQQIAVEIPPGYTCDHTKMTGCWVKLAFVYGAGNQPSDTTSWTANLDGDPVRLVP